VRARKPASLRARRVIHVVHTTYAYADGGSVFLSFL